MNNPIHILVAEDDGDISRLLCSIIKKSGYIPQPAYSGTEALLYLEQRQWSMLLLDLMLPSMTGEELLQQIDGRDDMPVIIISAKGEPKNKVSALRGGADDFITKPFDVEEVSARIDSLEQLACYNEHGTGKKIDVALFDQKLEALAEQINRHSNLVVESEANRKRVEIEFRQAVANISHDIRTPLTSILGYIQLLEAESITPKEKLEYIAVVKNRTRRLQALLNDFFELSVIESLDYSLQTEKLEMTVLLSEILVGFYDSYNERNITPDIRLPEEKMFVYADESAVRRVVENLLVNTVKHATGHVVISFNRQRETADFTIVNDAKELVGSDVNLLFNRFYTADRTRSDQASGLGLSIAKSLMKKMGGTLTAKLDGEKLMIICRWKLCD